MAGLKVGDSFPEGIKFTYVPPKADSEITSCGIPQPYNASENFKNKKVILVSVPGAFTPTCQQSHLPSYLESREALKAKGVDQVVVIAFNDAFVMSAWGKANNVGDDFFIFASDDQGFSKSIGWTMGERTARYAIAIDHGKVLYAEKEEVGKNMTVSAAQAVLPKL